MASRFRGARGFTLVETIVVVAIVAVLTGLVFALMGPSRERGRQAVCTSNLHQFYKAYQMYRQDWDGIDAEPGNNLTGSQVGLPTSNGLRDFQRQYHLDTEALLYCPDFHGKTLRNGGLVSSYSYSTFSQPSSLEVLHRLGMRAPLMVCYEHNPFESHSPQPTWQPMNVLFLRLNGEVKLRQLPHNRYTRFYE